MLAGITARVDAVVKLNRREPGSAGCTQAGARDGTLAIERASEIRVSVSACAVPSPPTRIH